MLLGASLAAAQGPRPMALAEYDQDHRWTALHCHLTHQAHGLVRVTQVAELAASWTSASASCPS